MKPYYNPSASAASRRFLAASSRRYPLTPNFFWFIAIFFSGLFLIVNYYYLDNPPAGNGNDNNLFLLRGGGSSVHGSSILPTTTAKYDDVARSAAETTSKESTEANDRAVLAAAELVDTLDAAREAADELRRVAAIAAHKKRVADRAANAAAAAAANVAEANASKNGGNKDSSTTVVTGGSGGGGDGGTTIAGARERRVKLKDGSEVTFSVFGRSDRDDISVFVLPYDTKLKTFTLIEEYHPGPNKRMIGLIAGMYESKHGGSPQKAAIWELSEEARLKMGDKSQIMELAPDAVSSAAGGSPPLREQLKQHGDDGLGYSQDKYSSAYFHPYLALDFVRDDRPRPRDREEEGGNLTIHDDITSDELKRMISQGKLNMPSTAFAMMGLQVLENKGLL